MWARCPGSQFYVNEAGRPSGRPCFSGATTGSQAEYPRVAQMTLYVFAGTTETSQMSINYNQSLSSQIIYTEYK